MIKAFIFFIFLLPVAAFAQLTISGRILNHGDTKPVPNASVFLSHATVGDKTAADGTFTLRNAKAGKYELVVSIVGFEAFSQPITVGKDMKLPDILIFPKVIGLQEVKIKPKYNRERNLGWFKDAFLGTSYLAADCRLINPDVLDFDYDEDKGILSASSSDFLEIENRALGYKIKYLVKDFLLNNKDKAAIEIRYTGSVLFENLAGTPAQEKRWQSIRQEVFENSSLHFLRAALSDRIEEEGFRAIRQRKINPLRPSDSVIDAKIAFFKRSPKRNLNSADSISVWQKKLSLPKMVRLTDPRPLMREDIIRQTDQKDIYVLCAETNNEDGLEVNYNKKSHFASATVYTNLNNRTETTLLKFNSPYVLFDNNGWIVNPNSVTLTGAWGRNRVAELLPVDYEPSDNTLPSIDNTTVFKNIFAAYKTFSADHQTGKAYLHFDKPYYAAGDTIYFKAYLTAGDKNEPDTLSGVLNVDLINNSSKIVRSIKLQLTDGTTFGDFALPDSLPKGGYMIRAYTQWMRNNGEDNFFTQTVPVGSLLTNKVAESGGAHDAVVTEKPDIQFFPEGGESVTGVTSKLAFKAVGTNGLGVAVSGVIADNKGRESVRFTATHLGMGSFYLKPEPGKRYYAKMTYADGAIDTAELPLPKEKGIVLSVNNKNAEKASIKIEANKAFYQDNKNKEYNLVIWSAGVITTIPCTLENQVITRDIIKRELHTGIAKITLFSDQGKPLCERLLFVQNNDQLDMSVNTDKNAYATRERVSLKINVKNAGKQATAGNFSISVTDESKVPVDENNESTILTSLLLTSELKGYIEQPNYYFANVTSQTQNDLDLIMLTHGYRRFEWKRLLDGSYPAVKYKPERSLEIAGVIQSPDGKPVAKGPVYLLSTLGGAVHQQETAGDGAFRFDNLTFMDSTRFMLRAANAKGKSDVKIIYNLPQPAPVIPLVTLKRDDVNKLMPAYLANKELQQEELAKYGPINGIVLNEVKVKDKQVKRDNDYPSSSIVGPGFADQVIRRSEFRGSGNFSDQFAGHLIGVRFAGPSGGRRAYLTQTVSLTNTGNDTGKSGLPTPMMVVVDGVKDAVLSVDELQVNDIETVEVLKSSLASVYGSLAGGGVLVITTRRGNDDLITRGKTPGILAIMPKGFYKARDFYAPKYNHTETSFKRNDTRSTIYWKPDLLTDKDGNAVINFYNADGKGDYRVVIEGFDELGNLCRKVYRYKVM